MSIVPDDKDWTWVIARPCPECGFDAADVDRSGLPVRIRETGAAWSAALERPDVARRTRDDRWSVLEYGCHVRDVYRVFLERLDLMLETDHPTFLNWDQDRTAVEDRYDLQDPAVVSGEVRVAADDLAARFAGVQVADWQRPGTRSNGSRFTVESLGVYSLHDPVHHLWDLTTL